MCKNCGNKKLYHIGRWDYCTVCDMFQEIVETQGGIMVKFLTGKGEGK